ncbi:MAG: TIM barrel protein [Thermoguttaceae bacterium]
MAKLKLGVELASFRLSIREALPAAAEVGAEAVEIDARGEITPQISRTGIRQLRKLLDDLRLSVSAVSFRTRGGYATLDGLDQRVAATKAAMDLAFQLGAPVVVNHLGPIPSDTNSETWRILIEVLQDLGNHGHRAGALLAAAAGAEAGPELATVLGALPDGALAVDLNPGKLLEGGFSPEETVAALGRWILHVHASDAATEASRSGPHLIAPGRGEVDFPSLLGALDEVGYRGYFTVQAPSSMNPRQELAEALEFLRRL